jgi:hypothetical protein
MSAETMPKKLMKKRIKPVFRISSEPRVGNSDRALIGTSHVERINLTTV